VSSSCRPDRSEGSASPEILRFAQDDRSLARFAAHAIALCALFVVTSCYDYRPLAPAVVPAGEDVRLDLTDQGRINVAPMAGAGVDRVDGTVEQMADSSLVLRVAAVRRRGIDESWMGERLRIARQDVEMMSVKQFSPWRTAGIVGAVALAATTVVVGGEAPIFGGKRSTGPQVGH
jgi:hypothetical protein